MTRTIFSIIKCGLRSLIYSSIAAGALAAAFAYGGYQPQKIETENKQNQPLEQTITVMSANIAACRGRPFSFWDLFPNPVTTWRHGGISYNGCKKLEQLINEYNISLAGLQEIEQNDVREEHQPQLFSNYTRLINYSFASNITHYFMARWFLADGNAVLSQPSIETSRWIPLEPEKPFSWGTIFDYLVGTEGIQHATVKYRQQIINIINVHLSNHEFTERKLSTGRIQREREMEFRQIFEYAAKITRQGPTIIFGDWNSVPPSLRTKEFLHAESKYLGEYTWEAAAEIIAREGLVLEHGGVLVNNNIAGSYHGEVPTSKLGLPCGKKDIGERIDMIFTLYDPLRNKIIPRLLSTTVLNEYLVSDHYPVIAEIRFEEN